MKINIFRRSIFLQKKSRWRSHGGTGETCAALTIFMAILAEWWQKLGNSITDPGNFRKCGLDDGNTSLGSQGKDTAACRV